MTQVSRIPLTKEVYQRIFELLQNTIAKPYNKTEVSLLLKDLLTPTERIMLAKRMACAVLLEKGYTYRDIELILKVSKGTVQSINTILKFHGKGLKTLAQAVLKEEKNQEFWTNIGEVFLTIGSRGKGSSGWRQLRKDLRIKRYKRQAAVV
jgi:uncharacterized protein YerC